MEDDKIKDLFSNFQPEMSSSFQFMATLKKNMATVEMLKQQNISLKKQNKLAVAIAAVCGFAMGVILTLLFPLLDKWVSTFSLSLPHLQISSLSLDYTLVAWIVITITCIITALNAYEIALAKLSQKENISI